MHEDPKVIDKVIKMMENEFGKMVVKRGQENDFLGIKVKYNNDGTVTFDMKEYLLKVIEMFDKELTSVTTLVKNNLFEYTKNLLLVNEKRRKKFYSIVMLLQYISHRGRCDIQRTTSILVSRVINAKKHDYDKLRQLTRYVKGTIDLVC